MPILEEFANSQPRRHSHRTRACMEIVAGLSPKLTQVSRLIANPLMRKLCTSSQETLGGAATHRASTATSVSSPRLSLRQLVPSSSAAGLAPPSDLRSRWYRLLRLATHNSNSCMILWITSLPNLHSERPKRSLRPHLGLSTSPAIVRPNAQG